MPLRLPVILRAFSKDEAMATDPSQPPHAWRPETTRPDPEAPFDADDDALARDTRQFVEWQDEEGEWGAEIEFEDDSLEEASRWRIDDRQLVQALGWFSIGLGVAELLAPRALGRAIGVGDHPGVMRMLGVREIVSGLGMLSERAPGTWAWSRVAGDAMDLALLGAASRSPEADPTRIAIATAGVLGVTALDVYASQRLSESQSDEAPQIAVSEAITINAAPSSLYQFWKHLENLPLFMRHLESVSTTGERTSHWVAKAPAGTSVEWDAEIVDEQPDRRIGWRTLPDSPAMGGRGTIVRVEMLYRPPAGKVGAQIAKLFGEEPRVQIDEDLRRLKQLMETGEVATTIGQPSGKRSIIGRATLGRRMQ
jgi:uncharacterized membrane protein